MRQYAAETTGPKPRATARRVARDPTLLRLLAAGDVAATRAYVAREFPAVWYHLHVSRLRITQGSRVIDEIGVPFTVAPAQVPLRSGGRTIGTLQVSIQDVIGYVRLLHRHDAVDVVVRGRRAGADVAAGGRERRAACAGRGDDRRGPLPGALVPRDRLGEHAADGLDPRALTASAISAPRARARTIPLVAPLLAVTALAALVRAVGVRARAAEPVLRRRGAQHGDVVAQLVLRGLRTGRTGRRRQAPRRPLAAGGEREAVRLRLDGAAVARGARRDRRRPAALRPRAATLRPSRRVVRGGRAGRAAGGDPDRPQRHDGLGDDGPRRARRVAGRRRRELAPDRPGRGRRRGPRPGVQRQARAGADRRSGARRLDADDA